MDFFGLEYRGLERKNIRERELIIFVYMYVLIRSNFYHAEPVQ